MIGSPKASDDSGVQFNPPAQINTVWIYLFLNQSCNEWRLWNYKYYLLLNYHAPELLLHQNF